jgi:hypothetical protein
MARHRNNPNMPFWKMIKEGYDHFEITRAEPKVDFCEKKYVFDAARAPNATRDPVFDASAKCPVYVIPDEIADAVRERQQEEAAETAKLISKGTPVARMNTGIDGGMNKVFAARVPDGNTGLSEGGDGQSLSLLAMSRAPGTIPSTVNPPKLPNLSQPDEPVVAVASTSAAPATRVASAAPPAQSDGFFSSLARKVGIGGSADATPGASAPPPTPAAKPKAADAKPQSVVRVAPKPAETKPETKQVAAAKPALKPSVTDTPAQAAAAPAAKDTQVAGSAPIVSSNSFDSRFGAVK